MISKEKIPWECQNENRIEYNDDVVCYVEQIDYSRSANLRSITQIEGSTNRSHWHFNCGTGKLFPSPSILSSFPNLSILSHFMYEWSENADALLPSLTIALSLVCKGSEKACQSKRIRQVFEDGTVSGMMHPIKHVGVRGHLQNLNDSTNSTRSYCWKVHTIYHLDIPLR